MIGATWVRAHQCFFLGFLSLCILGNTANAGFLPSGPELDEQSDFAFPSVTGDFTSNVLTVNGFNANTQLDIGPGTSADHSLFQSTLAVTGVGIDNAGAVTAGGSVLVTLGGFFPGGTFDTTYGPLTAGDILLSGTVVEVLLDGGPSPGGVGDDNLEVAFQVTGGLLAGDFGSTSVMKINGASGGGLPSNWSGDYSIGGTLDIIGPAVPEPSSIALGLLGTLFVLTRGSRRDS